MTQISNDHLARTGAILAALLGEVRQTFGDACRIGIDFDAHIAPPTWYIVVYTGDWKETVFQGDGPTFPAAVDALRADVAKLATPPELSAPAKSYVDALRRAHDLAEVSDEQ